MLIIVTMSISHTTIVFVVFDGRGVESRLLGKTKRDIEPRSKASQRTKRRAPLTVHPSVEHLQPIGRAAERGTSELGNNPLKCGRIFSAAEIHQAKHSFRSIRTKKHARVAS